MTSSDILNRRLDQRRAHQTLIFYLSERGSAEYFEPRSRNQKLKAFQNEPNDLAALGTEVGDEFEIRHGQLSISTINFLCCRMMSSDSNGGFDTIQRQEAIAWQCPAKHQPINFSQQGSKAISSLWHLHYLMQHYRLAMLRILTTFSQAACRSKYDPQRNQPSRLSC